MRSTWVSSPRSPRARRSGVRTSLLGSLAVLAAIATDHLRLDGSDQMPLPIGQLLADDGLGGAFWQGMVDWVDGDRSIEEVFADIDAEWAALKAAEGS